MISPVAGLVTAKVSPGVEAEGEAVCSDEVATMDRRIGAGTARVNDYGRWMTSTPGGGVNSNRDFVTLVFV